MKIKVTGFNVMDVPEGTRIGFTYSEVTEEGKITRQNAKGSMIVFDEKTGNEIGKIKEFIKNWIETSNAKEGK